MKLAQTLFAATALAAAALFVAPASADHGRGPPEGGSSSGGSKDPTSVPEPADAVLLLMGATGVVIGRSLHARARRKG